MADFARSIVRAARQHGELAPLPAAFGHRLAVNHRRPAEAASVLEAPAAKAMAGQAERAKKLAESRKIYERNMSGTPEELARRQAEVWAKIQANNARIDAARQKRREAIEANRVRGVAPGVKVDGTPRKRRPGRGR